MSYQIHDGIRIYVRAIVNSLTGHMGHLYSPGFFLQSPIDSVFKKRTAAAPGSGTYLPPRPESSGLFSRGMNGSARKRSQCKPHPLGCGGLLFCACSGLSFWRLFFNRANGNFWLRRFEFFQFNFFVKSFLSSKIFSLVSEESPNLRRISAF